MDRRDQFHDEALEPPAPSNPDDRVVRETLERTLAYARTRDYRGWDYGDGMSSRLLRALPVEHKWLNIAFQETAKRAPVNVRPLLLVEQRRNYQGIALFAMASRTLDRLGASGTADSGERGGGAGGGSESGNREVDEGGRGSATGEPAPGGGTEADAGPVVDYGREARRLLDWLLAERSEGYGGFCGGYRHPIQHLDGRGEPGEPDLVNTSFAAKALLRGGAYDDRYPAAVRDAADFVVEDLDYRPVEGGRGAVVDYHTKHPEDYYTINAGALGARLFVDLYDRFREPELLERARGILDHIADLQTDLGGWYYRDPPEASHLSMDNHHNGFVIEAFQRYRAAIGDRRYADTLDAALWFYRTVLFEDDGAPNFDETAAYPRDVHASAQGILVFTYAGNYTFARRILQWALEHLHAGGGRFLFREERLFTRRVTLMRWCQAWMAYAMAEYLGARAAKRVDDLAAGTTEVRADGA